MMLFTTSKIKTSMSTGSTYIVLPDVIDESFELVTRYNYVVSPMADDHDGRMDGQWSL